MNRKPNILFILSDDQGAWAMGCAGNNELRTPNLDRLAADGLMFTNFFCASPVCSPARASILTGTIPSVHGVHDWLRGGNINMERFPQLRNTPGSQVFASEHTAVEYLRDFTAYTDILAANGYHCALSGKWHLGDSLNPQHGFQSWFTIARGGCPYYHADTVKDGEIRFETEYITDIITDNALQTLDHLCADDAPFYLSVHYTAPHSPWDEKNHPKEYLNLYRDCPFDSIPDVAPHPWRDPESPHAEGEARRERLRGYFAAVTAMDHGIGRIIRRLEEQNKLSDTLIVFTSDNGMNMGHHGIWGKGNGTFPQNMYDTSVKVPFIVSHRGKVQPGVCHNLVSHYDIFPTLMDYLNVPAETEQTLIGRSFADALRGKPLDPDGFVVVFDEYGPVRMIRDAKWKYVHRYPYGPHELYHLERDPEEENNLAQCAEHREIIESLKHKLDQFYVRYADPHVDGTREAVSGYGQLRKCGVYSNGKDVYYRT